MRRGRQPDLLSRAVVADSRDAEAPTSLDMARDRNGLHARAKRAL